MTKKHHTIALIVTLTVLTSFACSVLKEPTAIPASPTAAVQALPTHTALPTSTPAPTPTPAPTHTPTHTPTPLPPVAPRLAYFSPARGEEQSLDGNVVLVFDQPMNAAAVEAAFSIDPPVEGAFTWPDARTMIFAPKAAFDRATPYRVRVDETAASDAGLPLREAVDLHFATVGYLEVTAVQPADTTTQVDMATRITVMFNRPVVPLTSIGQQADLPQPLAIDPPVSGKGEWLNTSIYLFTPDDGLAPATTYTARVAAGLTDTTGGVLAEDYIWNFATKLPAVVRTKPANQAIYASPTTTVTVTFNQPMDRDSTEEHFQLTPDGSQDPLPGTFTWMENNTVLVFEPDTPLAMNEQYQAIVRQGALAAGGAQGTEFDYAWRFRTIEYPRVVKTTPYDGSTSADPYGSVRITFSSPMSPTTLAENLSVSYRDLLTGDSGAITATNVYSYWYSSDTVLNLSIGRGPSRAYTITLGADLTGRYGHKLNNPYTFGFTTRELDALIYSLAPGNVGTYNAYTTTLAYVAHRNVSEITFSLYTLGQRDFLRLNGWDSWQVWDGFEPDLTNLVREWTIALDAPLNQTGIASTPITTLEDGDLEPGLYFLKMSSPDVLEDNWHNKILIVSHTNLTLKRTLNETLIWATDLLTGLPVPGAEIVLFDERGNQMASGATDGDGVLRITHPEKDMWQPFVAVGKLRGDLTAAVSTWNEGILPWDFNLETEFYAAEYVGHLYTDRPIYRPSQKVYFKGIFRQDQDARYRLPDDVAQVTVRIEDPQGKKLYEEKLPVSEMGTFYGELELGEEAALGYYYIWAQINDEGFGGSFQVAEYRKPEFQVAVDTDQPAYVQGDEINASALATYYFGGPVAQADVSWAVLTNDYWFNYTGRGRYDFTDYDWTTWRYQPYSGYGELLAEGQGQTNAEGRFTFSVPADIAEKTQSQVFTLEVTVTDVNNQQVSNRIDAVVHMGAFYIGLAPQRYVGRVNEEQKVDLVTVDWDSNPAPEIPLTVVFYERQWYNVQQQGEDGLFYWTWEAQDTPVFTTTVTTAADGQAIAAFTPQKGGIYKIAAWGRDEFENPVRSSTFMWVSGRDYVTWRMDNNDRIDLIADKKSYAVGDVAEILVPSPYQGRVQALMTVERGRIIEHRLITLETNSDVIKLPILPDYAPDVFVSLVIVKGMDETNPLSSFKIGYTKLSISTAEKEINVQLTPEKDTYQPREAVTYQIETTDHSGRPVQAELSLNLVDKAVLALAGNSGETLLDRFYRERGVSVMTASGLVLSVDRLIEANVPQEAKGGGGGEFAAEGATVRSRFPDTAYWNPAIVTDADGQASVTVELPDNLTTWQMGAKGVTADTLVGESTVDIVSTLPLLVRPVTPRFFVAGDEATLSAVLHNNTDTPITAQVSLAAEGLTFEAAVQNVQVPAQDKIKVDWHVTVQQAGWVGATGQSVLLFQAQQTDGNLSDAVEISLPIYRYSTPELVATAGQLETADSRTETVVLPDRFDPTQGELTLHLDPSLAAGMRDGLDYLEHYPYECIEQAVSRFLPNVITYRALKQLGIENAELETKLPQQVGIGLQRIYARQKYDGGWGWWVNDDSNPFLTAYVLLGLVQADRAGFTVDADVVERAGWFLRDSLVQPQDVKYPWQGNQQAFILYVLAEAGQGDQGRTVRLFERRDVLGNYGKAYLALALHILEPDVTRRTDALLSDLIGGAILSATGAHWEEDSVDYWTMNTNNRSTSIVLDTLVRLDPENDLIPNVVRWLMVSRQDGHWETTQETVWALIALTDVMVSSGELQGDYSWLVTLNGETLGEGDVTPDDVDQTRKLQAAIADLLLDETNRVEITRLAPSGQQSGQGQLYYSAYLRYFLPVKDVQALSRGIIVGRQYTLVDEPEKTVSQAQVGDVIQVRLTIVAPNDLHYVVVEDPLPAGCEAVDQSLKTTSVVGQSPEIERVDEWDTWNWGWWWFSHTEIRDEKVALFATYLPKGTYEYTYLMRASVPGAFHTMPALAYEMYFPEVFGRSDGGRFTVEE
ncbi:MAG: Ig-like domain-containing protein [Chloroflexota bacterium]